MLLLHKESLDPRRWGAAVLLSPHPTEPGGDRDGAQADTGQISEAVSTEQREKTGRPQPLADRAFIC